MVPPQRLKGELRGRVCRGAAGPVEKERKGHYCKKGGKLAEQKSAGHLLKVPA